jgi:hypothetical protein
MISMCAKKAKLALTVAKPSNMIRTHGGRVLAKQITREVLLELAISVTRDRCDFGNDLDEATQSYSGYS